MQREQGTVPLAGFQEAWLTGAHGRMRYWQSAARDGVPLVLIHGYSALIEFWNDVLPTLAAAHTVYALDLYGFGRSAKLTVPPDKQIWVEQVGLFLEQVVGRPAAVVGHSLGGTVAAEVAKQYAPRVQALVLIGSTGIADIAHLYRIHERLFYLGVQIPLVGEAVSLMFGRHITITQFLRAVYYRRERIRPELVRRFYPTLTRPSDALFRLKVLRGFNSYALDLQPGDVAAPVLILWGDHDPAFPLQLAYTFQMRYFPQAEVRLIADSGHCPFDETPQAFCAALLPWLAEHRPRPLHPIGAAVSVLH